MGENVVKSKAIAFSIRVVKLYKYLSDMKKEYVISKQLLRSRTAIGALVCESEYAESKMDFVHKLHIAIKEANETAYWLLLLKETEYITGKEFESIEIDISELMKLLTSIINTTKQKHKKVLRIMNNKQGVPYLNSIIHY